MANPILNQLNSNQGSNNKPMDPNIIFNNMMQTNPQFRAFVEQNRNKTPEQIAQENGIDLKAAINQLFGKPKN